MMLPMLLAFALGADGGAGRACVDGVRVVAVDEGRFRSPITEAEVVTLAELSAIAREIPVLTAQEARRHPRVPELVITQHLFTIRDDLFFLIRAELRETWPDSSGKPTPVIVWQAPPVSGVTYTSEPRDVLLARITEAAIRALHVCRSP